MAARLHVGAPRTTTSTYTCLRAHGAVTLSFAHVIRFMYDTAARLAIRVVAPNTTGHICISWHNCKVVPVALPALGVTSYDLCMSG